MPGLDPQVAMHRLNIKPDIKPVKQQQRRFRPQVIEAIEAEVKKLIESGFIREEQHPDWVANIVPVLKKNGKIRTVEYYVDDLVVKSHDKGNHLHDLKIMFDLMRAHQPKMNPTKSFLGMASGKFLGFVITANRIRLDPDKVKAIQELPPPRNLKELRGLQGRLAYIHRFISNLLGKYQPFSKLMKKGVSFMWDEACQKAFEEIKRYLSNPSILVTPKSGKPFLIYIRATNHALAGLLAQDDENGHEQAVYYLSRTLSGAEPCYPLIEKEYIKERESIRRRAPRFYYDSQSQTLYRKSYDGILLRCLSNREAKKLLKNLMMASVELISLVINCRTDYEDWVITGLIWFKMLSPVPNDAMPAKYMLIMCIDHPNIFIRQLLRGLLKQAITLREVKTSDVVKFLEHHIVYRYGVPRIKNLASTAYNPAANGQAEAFNKTIVRILTKVVSTNKRDWNEKLGQSLWAYCTTVRTPTGATPYSLVYGYKAVLPLEIQIPSLRIALVIGMTTEESHHRRLEELEALDEKRLLAQQHIELYQAQIFRAFNKNVRYRTFKEGDLVLAVRCPMILNSKKKGKFEPKWEGPFVVETVYLNGVYHLITQNSDKLMMPINGKFLKKYYT
ncbi:uncharacterized protein LOC109841874 [Asparagus officinalis]|uniref:uncharacterized protein LOC109841874 n=1 Tax=Asparagus officinalis TaxID=4686 RepID=UPI00098E0809|nr:uncharacterized protein LOC109841874 [Asparagus officinalis]